MTVTKVSGERKKLHPLTALRFFAAALIVVLHAGGRGLGPHWPFVFSLGQGVSFFFVLSGFVLAYNHPRLADWRAVREFYIARVARVWPSHIAATVLYVVFIGNVSFYSLPDDSRGLITLAYISMVHAWVPVSEYVTAYNTVSWSISTEFFFYLAFPLLIGGLGKSWHWKLTLTFVVACIMWWLANRYALAPNGTEDGRGNIGYINPLARVFEFALGIGLCGIYTSYAKAADSVLRGFRATVTELAVLLLALGSLWLSRQLATSPYVIQTFGETIAMVLETSGFGVWVFAMVIFVFAVGNGAVSKLLSTRPMIFLGEISFGLYLVHTLFLLYRQQAPGVFEGLPSAQVYILYWLCGLALATLIHLGVERPCQSLIGALGRGLNTKLFRDRCMKALAVSTVPVLALIYFQPSTRSVHQAPPAAKANLLSGPVVFSPGYRLDSVEMLQDSIRFSWTAEEDVTLAKRVAVHLLDASGKMRGQLDYAIETGYRSASKGEQWSNYVSKNGYDFKGISSFGVAVYDNRGMNSVLDAFRSQTDWNGVRLLISLGDKG